MNVNAANIETLSDEEVDEVIRKYFSADEWKDLPDVEKLRNRLTFVNYVSHPQLAHLTPIPRFLENSNGELFLSELTNSSEIKKKSRGRKSKTDIKNEVVVKIPKKSTTTDKSDTVRRNPERNSKAKISNYQEEEIPEDDRYIFCDKCQKDVLDYCDTCGMLVVVKDVKVTVGVPDRARKTAPSIFEIRESTLHGLGVFARSRLPQGIQLGPYEGTVTRVSNTNGYSWKLRNGKLVDAADETVANWMRYVNCATHFSAQNLVAFQYKGGLYYRTARPIQKGEELLVYYGNSFAKELGIEPKKYFNPQIEDDLKPYYTCKYCQIGLSLQKFRDVHEKHCRFRNPMPIIYTGETFQCCYCKVLYSSKEYRDVHLNHCRKRPKSQSRDHVEREVNEKYACHTCDFETNHKGSLKVHLPIHDKENARKHSCSKCPFTTIHKCSLIRHLKKHSAFGLICQYCAKSFNGKKHLDGHYISRHPDKSDTWKDTITSKIYKCFKCHYRTVQTGNFKNHVLIHDTGTNRMKYHCAICQFNCIQKGNFTRHLRLHVVQLPFVCTECNKRFNEKTNLDRHIVTKHAHNKQLMNSVTNKINYCPKCSYKTVNCSHFKNHVLIHDTGTNRMKYHCAICHFNCIQKGNFTRHLRLHVDQLPFVCTECNKRFNVKVLLDGHIVAKHAHNKQLMDTVTNKINYCPKCSYKTVQCSNLKSHLSTHNK